MITLFETGSRWRHRGTGLVVVIHVVEDGVFSLTPEQETVYDPDSGDRIAVNPDGMLQYAVQGLWTAEDLVKGFDPLDIAPGRYERILEDAIIDSDEDLGL